jgi:hypothetical protein
MVPLESLLHRNGSVEPVSINIVNFADAPIANLLLCAIELNQINDLCLNGLVGELHHCCGADTESTLRRKSDAPYSA